MIMGEQRLISMTKPDQTMRVHSNLCFRRAHGWSRKGTRAVQERPPARGPNLHVIGAVSCEGVVLITKHRDAFRNNECNLWIAQVLEKLEAAGKRIEDVVIVCDNAPCHSRLENALNNTGAKLLRLVANNC